MIRTKFYVHSDVDDNNIYAEFDNQVDAIAYASGFSPMDKCYVVEATVDVDEESGEVLRELESEKIWSFEDLPTEDAFGVNDWPDVSIKDEEEMKLDTDFDVKDIHEKLEAKEDLVECQHCFDLFPKEECTKIEYGYLCPHCHSLVVKEVEFPSEMVDDATFGLEFPEPYDFEDDGDEDEVPGEYTEVKPEEPAFVSADEIAPEEPVAIEPSVEETPEVSIKTPAAFADMPVTAEGSGIEDGSSDDSSDDSGEILDEHVQDRPAPIEDTTKIQGGDNAVVDCETEHKIIAHSEDEKPLDCLMKKPALEEPLAGEKVDIKLNERLDDELIAFAASLPEDLHEEVLDEGPFDIFKKAGNAIADKFTGGKHSFNKNHGGASFKLYQKENGKKDWNELVLKEPIKDIKNAQETAKALSTKSNIAGVTVKIAADKPENEQVVLVYKKGTEIVNNIKDINSNDKTKAKDDEITKKAGVVGIKEPEEKPAEEPVKEEPKEEPKAEEKPAEKAPVTKRDMSKQNEARAQYKNIEKALEILGVNKDILRDGNKVTQKFKDLRKALFTESYPDMPFDSDVKEGDKIRIIHLEGEDNSYDGKEGTVDRIDSIGQLHGTWGGLAVIPGVDEFEIITEELIEAKKDEEEPVDPEQAKLDAHTMLNQLVADEIEAIDGYEASKAELLDKPLEHKEEIIHTIDHIKDEEKEHIDELIQATRKIPFEKPAMEELDEDIITEKPEGDKIRSYNDGLKLAKVYGKPVIYGYTNGALNDKFFALEDPIVCDDVNECSRKFKAQYKNCNIVYVVYPDKWFISEELHKNEEALVAEWARQGVETGMIFDESDYDQFAKICKIEGIEPSEELFKHYFKCVDDLVGVKEESLEWTADKDLADNRTPAPTEQGELSEPLDGSEVRKHEKAIVEDADVDYVEYMHSYCNALEPHMDELRKIEDVEELKKAILDIVNRDPDVNTTEKKNKFVWLIKNKKWSSAKNIMAYLDKAMKKAKGIEVKVDDNGELVKEDLEDEEIEVCAWCGEEYPVSDLHKEVDLGYLCPDCEQAIKSRGEKLTFEE